MSAPILILDPTSRVPPYEQIETQIRWQIATKHLLPGAFLPSVRQLARDLRIAPNTVVRAYNALERDGWVITSARRGVLVASPSLAQVAKFRAHAFEQAITELMVTAQKLGMTPTQVHAEIDRLLQASPDLGSRGEPC